MSRKISNVRETEQERAACLLPSRKPYIKHSFPALPVSRRCLFAFLVNELDIALSAKSTTHAAPPSSIMIL